MNITDKDGLYKLTVGHITDLQTNETRPVSNMPSANAIAYMDYDTYIRKCGEAFHSGEWPITHWASGRATR